MDKKENPFQQLLVEKKAQTRSGSVATSAETKPNWPFLSCAGQGWELGPFHVEAAPSPEGGMLLASLRHPGERVFMSAFSLLAFNGRFSSTNRKRCIFIFLVWD